MAREIDLVIFGATGYTGRLVAEYLVKNGAGTRWAMAGRSAAKLAEIRELIGAPRDTPLIVADAADDASLQTMVQRTQVVLTTAGPYQLYGDRLVAACAAAGTDYVDLAGESDWIARMIGQHQALARQSGARLVFSGGFDSVPFDMGVYFVQQQAHQQFGAYAPRVRGRVRAVSGGLSGGTLASGAATLAALKNDPALATRLADPFLMTPGFRGPVQPDLNATFHDAVTGSWVAPFMMARINTKTVHRTNLLLGHRWGTDFAYDEMTMVAGPDASPGVFSVVPTFMPGEGPTLQEREAGYYDLLYIAEYADGRTLRAAVRGDRDPGYASTAKIIAECALCLLEDVSRDQTAGGCWTAVAAMAEPLLARLQERAGVRFSVEA